MHDSADHFGTALGLSVTPLPFLEAYGSLRSFVNADDQRSPGLLAVAAKFGRGVIREDGTLDRERLGSLVFADEEKRRMLNSILHPYIIARQDELLREWETKDPNDIAVVDAALMIESGGYKRFDKLIVVHCTSAEQFKRIMIRDNLSRAEAEERIRAQLPQEEKKSYADYLIDTSAGFEATRKRTAEVYRQLRSIRVQSPEEK